MDKGTKRTKEVTTESDYMPIEKVKKMHNTSTAIFQGVCMMQGWATGKQVTEKEYQSAVTAFLKSGVGGN